tara:strand:- start:40231 stop:40575 length:345 start_codon:yes stop_codon:yes gene_type:complete
LDPGPVITAKGDPASGLFGEIGIVIGHQHGYFSVAFLYPLYHHGPGTQFRCHSLYGPEKGIKGILVDPAMSYGHNGPFRIHIPQSYPAPPGRGKFKERKDVNGTRVNGHGSDLF